MGSAKQVVDSVIRTDPNFAAYIDTKAVSNTDVPFDFIIWALDELYYVSDRSGTKHRLAQLVLKGTCGLETSTIPLKRANYGSASVLHGSATDMRRPVRVAWVEREDRRLMFGASFGEPEHPNT